MKVLILDTYYQRFLDRMYDGDPLLASRSYNVQLEKLLGASFGTSDFYSRHLRTLGVDAADIVANCAPLQFQWGAERGIARERAGARTLLRRLKRRLRREPERAGFEPREAQ